MRDLPLVARPRRAALRTGVRLLHSPLPHWLARARCTHGRAEAQACGWTPCRRRGSRTLGWSAGTPTAAVVHSRPTQPLAAVTSSGGRAPATAHTRCQGREVWGARAVPGRPADRAPRCTSSPAGRSLGVTKLAFARPAGIRCMQIGSDLAVAQALLIPHPVHKRSQLARRAARRPLVGKIPQQCVLFLPSLWTNSMQSLHRPGLSARAPSGARQRAAAALRSPPARASSSGAGVVDRAQPEWTGERFGLVSSGLRQSRLARTRRAARASPGVHRRKRLDQRPSPHTGAGDALTSKLVNALINTPPIWCAALRRAGPPATACAPAAPNSNAPHPP